MSYVSAVEDFRSVHLYFYDESLLPERDFTFIDGGAYDGDSIEIFVGKYGDRVKKIYAFEPNEAACREMQQKMSALM